MMNKIPLVLLSALVLSLGACAKKNDCSIALMTSSTITKPGYNKAMQYGCRLIIDRVNEMGGIQGKQIGLEVFDDNGNPELAKEHARRIARRKDIVAVVGYVLPECLRAARDVYDRGGIPVITPTVSDMGILGKSRTVFRNCFNDEKEGTMLATYSMESLATERVFLLIQGNECYAQMAAVYETTSAGVIEVVGKMRFEPGEVEFSNLALKVKSHDPDLIVIAGGFREAGLIAGELRKNRIRIPIIGASEMMHRGFIDIASEDRAEGAMAVTPFLYLKNLNERMDAFNDGYAKLSGRNATWVAFITAEAASMAIAAMRSAGFDRAKVIEALQGMNEKNPYDGIAGKVYFDAQGECTRPVIIAQVIKGKWSIAEKQLRKSEKIY
ncbi:MAG: ABC transporter substrate-binding protein [Spirochaetes bacterium]|nr:ABC transporter substrate-binding protein [Spirochaetota bacterium]